MTTVCTMELKAEVGSFSYWKIEPRFA